MIICSDRIAFGKKEAEVPVKKVILSVKANGATEPKPEDKPKKEEPKEKEGNGYISNEDN